MVIPGVILCTEGWDVTLTAALCKVLVREVCVLDEPTDVSTGGGGVRGSWHCGIERKWLEYIFHIILIMIYEENR